MSKVLMVLEGKYPFDIRVEKEISALCHAHEITLFCSKDSARDFAPTDFQIVRSGPSVGKLTKTLRDMHLGFFFFDLQYYLAIRAELKKNHYDVIHVHDLSLFNTVRKAASHEKLILDLHENLPEATQIWFNWRKSWPIRLKNKLVNNYNRWQRFEKKAVHDADHVIAVVDEMQAKLIREHGADPKKITVVTNSESLSFNGIVHASASLDTSAILKKADFNLLYVGGIGPHRGLDDAIVGMASLIKHPQGATAKLHIVGSGHADNINYLKHLVRLHQLEDVVFFHGSVPFNHVSALMQHANVNIIPHKSNGHCDNTIPHKLFQCMMSNAPLLVSSSAPLARIVQGCNGGYVFEADKPADFARVALEIVQNHDQATQRATRAKDAVTTGNLNWENTAEILLSLYKQLSTNNAFEASSKRQ